MNKNSETAFRELLQSVYALESSELTDGVFALWLSALKSYSLEEIRAAFDVFMANPENAGKRIVPAYVIKIIHETRPKPLELCWHCQGDLGKLGRTKLRDGYVCNPCYRGYIAGEWSPERAA